MAIFHTTLIWLFWTLIWKNFSLFTTERPFKNMRNHFLSIYLFGILVFLLSNTNIFASQDLFFSETPTPTAQVLLNNFLKNTKKSTEDFTYSEHDINNDGFPEFFLKSKKCDVSSLYCKFYILAKKGTEIILLLELQAKKIAISDTKTNGIHDILAIRDKKNDYKYEQFIWSPIDMAFKSALTND